MKIIRLIS